MSLRLRWLTADPAGTAMRLASTVGGRVDVVPGDPPDGGGRVIPLVGGEIVVSTTDGPDRLLLESAPNAPGAPPEPSDAELERAILRGAPRLLGVGWASVDAGRAVPEVAAAFGLTREAFRPATPDAALGATAIVGRLPRLAVAILEPSTEGRVAAALARSGEGPCAVYVATSASGPSGPGPLGAAWLAMSDRRSGPFVIAVQRRASSTR
jgi:hypothetical protein